MAEKKNAKVVKYASRGQWRDLVRELDKGASVNATDGKRRSALFLAALNGKKKCLKELLRRGADPNQYVHSHVRMRLTYTSYRFCPQADAGRTDSLPCCCTWRKATEVPHRHYDQEPSGRAPPVVQGCVHCCKNEEDAHHHGNREPL